mgnify:CR=1 FL=1
MQFDLSGKTPIVSGSTAWIGLAAAEGLVGAAARVVITVRTQPYALPKRAVTICLVQFT